MCTLFNVPLYSHQRLQDHLIIINREDLNKAFKNSVDWKAGVIRPKCNNSQETIYALIENDHVGDWSTEMHHLQSQAWFWRWIDSEDGFCKGCQNVSRQQQSFSGLQWPRWLLTFFNQGMLLLGSNYFLIDHLSFIKMSNSSHKSSYDI